MIRVTLLGEVDHGKSTLIGRVMQECSATRGTLPSGIPAFVMDGLAEEREELFTLDTAQTVIEVDGRRVVLIDVPGHLPLLRNMMTGASQADAGLLCVDVEQGIGLQTRRHLSLLGLLGVRNVIAACNKMDRVHFARAPFAQVEDALRNWTRELNLTLCHCIPIAALYGDNILIKSKRIEWYRGATLVEMLGALPQRALPNALTRFVIQDRYLRDGVGLYVGRVESGDLRPGPHRLYPSGRKCEVASIERYGEPRLTSATSGQCVGVRLEPDPGGRPGDVIATSSRPPRIGDRLRARIVNVGKENLVVGESLQLRTALDRVPGRLASIERCMNSETLEVVATDVRHVGFAEVADVHMQLDRPIVYDRFSESEALGRFVLVANGKVASAGIIEEKWHGR